MACQLKVQLSGPCVDCQDLEPILDNKIESTKVWNGERYETISEGVCTLTCLHWNVCKNAIDSGTKIVFAELSKKPIPV